MTCRKIKDEPASLAATARRFLDGVEMVLISRGAKGGLLVTKQGVWQARCGSEYRLQAGRLKPGLQTGSTVGCGDYLLAGFLKSLDEDCDPAAALKTAVKVATAKAWGRTE